MTAIQAHPAIRLPVGRLAPIVVGAAAFACGLIVASIAIIRTAELWTAAVAGGAVVIATGAMYLALGLIRVRHLLTLTTIVMGLSMVRLVASVVIGMAYMLTAAPEGGVKPDKFVFAVVFLGVSLVVLGVETPLLRRAIQSLGGPGPTPAARTDSDPSATPSATSTTPAGAHS